MKAWRLNNIGDIRLEDMELPIMISQTIGIIDQTKGHFQMKTVMPAMFHWETFLQFRIDFLFIEIFHGIHLPL